MAQTMRTCRPNQAAFSARPARVQLRQAKRIARVQCAAQATAEPKTDQTYYALVANAEFFVNDVQNESLAEQLRERVRYLNEQNRPVDFYLVPNPVWLDTKFAEQGKQVKRPSMALVSTDKMWTIFMKLRLDRVLKIELEGLTADEVLQMGAELPEYKMPGKWTAPYSPYAADWWKVFYPKN